MESPFSPPATTLETDADKSSTASVASETEAAPARKRGVFLPGRLFGGKAKERAASETAAPENTEFSSPMLSAPKLDPLSALALPVSEGASPEPEPAASASTGRTSETPPSPDATSKTLGSKLALSTLSDPDPSTAAASSLNPLPPVPSNNDLTNRASAQLTLSFEIASLQLTPYFKIGSIQLKALSNVVSLHLITAGEAGAPLPAAISFQISHVELAGDTRLKSLLLKPLGEAREAAAPLPRLQTDGVTLSGHADAPIAVTTSAQASTPVQFFGTFTVVGLDFSPTFEVDSLLLEPTSRGGFVRIVPSARPTALDLPPSFEIAEIQIDGDAQIVGARLVPSVARKA